MALIFRIYSIIILWTAGLRDWIVVYATAVAQLGIWVTLASLIPFSAFWLSLKRQFFINSQTNEMPVTSTRAHWGISVK